MTSNNKRMPLRMSGTKLGMTQRFDEKGSQIPCTVLQFDPNVVVQKKTKECDGYEALVLASHPIKVRQEYTLRNRLSKPQRGLYEKVGVAPHKRLQESRMESTQEYEMGQALGLDLFTGVKKVDVTGVTKGKGYQGVMKRHGFRGGPAAHGSGFHRHGGSTGMRSTPGRCLPGQKKAGQMGGVRQTTQSIEVVELLPEKGIMIVKGAVPGPVGGRITVSSAMKVKVG